MPRGARQLGWQRGIWLEGRMARCLGHGESPLMGSPQPGMRHMLVTQAKGAAGCGRRLVSCPSIWSGCPKELHCQSSRVLSLPGAGQPNTEGPRAAPSLRAMVSVKRPVCSSFSVTSRKKFKYKILEQAGHGQAYCMLNSS